MALFREGMELIGQVRSPEGTIQTQEFLAACRHAERMFEYLLVGLCCSLTRYDVSRNITIVAAASAADPALYGQDLFRTIRDAVADGGPSCRAAVSLLWLKRGIHFFVATLVELCKDPALRTNQAVKISYRGTLERYHNMVLVLAFRAGMSFVHSRQRFMQSVGIVGADEAEGMKAMADYCREFGALLGEVHDFLGANGLDHQDKVSKVSTEGE